MATMWALIEMCIADARRAEELISDTAARRELRLDPYSALAEFSLFGQRSETAQPAAPLSEAA